MTKLLSSLLLITLLLAGCATAPRTDPDAATIKRINSLSYLAASIGAATVIEEYPATAPKFALAYQNLNTLVNAKAVNGAELRAIVASLPLDGLKSGHAQVYIEAALFLFDETLGDQISLEYAPYALAAATGMRDGLKVALGL